MARSVETQLLQQAKGEQNRKEERLTKLKKLSWELTKCIFSKSFEFVGHHLSLDCNLPSTSKIPTLQTWPFPEIVRDIAGFIAFGSFYGKYIPYFEDGISNLRELTKLPYDTPLTATSNFTTDILSKYKDIKKLFSVLHAYVATTREKEII
eukprot:scaffold105304_cov50-Attheya_sp.AAC.3